MSEQASTLAYTDDLTGLSNKKLVAAGNAAAQIGGYTGAEVAGVCSGASLGLAKPMGPGELSTILGSALPGTARPTMGFART